MSALKPEEMPRRAVAINTAGLAMQMLLVGLQLIVIPLTTSTVLYGSIQSFLASAYITAIVCLGGLQSVTLIALSRGKYSSVRVSGVAITHLAARLLFLLGCAALSLAVNTELTVVLLLGVAIATLLMVDSVLLAQKKFGHLFFRRVLPDLSVLLLVPLMFSYSKPAENQYLPLVSQVLLVAYGFPALFFLRALLPYVSFNRRNLRNLRIQKVAMPFIAWTFFQVLMQRGSILVVANYALSSVIVLRCFQYVAQIGQQLANGPLLVILRQKFGDGGHIKNRQQEASRSNLPDKLLLKVVAYGLLVNLLAFSALFILDLYFDQKVLPLTAETFSVSTLLCCATSLFQWTSSTTNWTGHFAAYLKGQASAFMLFCFGVVALAVAISSNAISSEIFLAVWMALLLAVCRAWASYYYWSAFQFSSRHASTR